MGKSPEGKLKSSFNSTSHGALSKRKLLPGEDAAELEACAAGWIATYAPQDYREQRLVDQLILNDWFLRRATHRLMELEASAGEGGADFEHRLGLMQRYKTTAERAFYRSVTAVESLRKDLRREQQAKQKNEGKREKREQKPEREIRLAEQWVEVRVDEKGKTSTTKHPPDEVLRERVKELDPARDLVYRRLNFVDGVPREYEWAMHDPAVRETGGAGVQRMRLEVWVAQIEREARVGKGHLLGCKNVPRPEERGGCECPTCEANRDG